jgi:hypothetical protein
MVCCDGYESRVNRMLMGLRMLTAHHVVHDSAMPLMPKATQMDLPGTEKGIRVDAGSLGLSASGGSTTLLLTRWSHCHKGQRRGQA